MLSSKLQFKGKCYSNCFREFTRNLKIDRKAEKGSLLCGKLTYRDLLLTSSDLSDVDEYTRPLEVYLVESTLLVLLSRLLRFDE